MWRESCPGPGQGPELRHRQLCKTHGPCGMGVGEVYRHAWCMILWVNPRLPEEARAVAQSGIKVGYELREGLELLWGGSAVFRSHRAWLKPRGRRPREERAGVQIGRPRADGDSSTVLMAGGAGSGRRGGAGGMSGVGSQQRPFHVAVVAVVPCSLRGWGWGQR